MPFGFMLWLYLLLVLLSIYWTPCPLYVFRDKWFSIIDLHEVQNRTVTKSHRLLTVWGQQVHSLMNYSSCNDVSKPICLLFLVKKTPSLGYHSYRVTEEEHVWRFDDKDENCRQENRKQNGTSVKMLGFISTSHYDYITGPECVFSAFSLLSSFFYFLGPDCPKSYF